MNFPIVVQKDKNGDYSVTVPDLLGCISSGETMEAALVNTREAIEIHLEDIIKKRYAIPVPTEIEQLRKNPEFKGGIWAVVPVDISKIPAKTKRVHITMHENLLEAIDNYAKRHGQSRSGLLARAALEFIAKH